MIRYQSLMAAPLVFALTFGVYPKVEGSSQPNPVQGTETKIALVESADGPLALKHDEITITHTISRYEEEEQRRREEERKKTQTVRETLPRATVDNLDGLLARHFPAHAIPAAKRIITCESGGNQNAVGDGHLTYMHNGAQYGKSYGLFQVRHLPGRPSPEWLLQPENNVEYAARLYRSSSWKPWTCARKVGVI